MTTLPFSRPFRVGDLSGAGTTVTLTATPSERQALAAEAGLVAIDALEAELTLRPTRHGFTISGSLEATVVQTCVVTLDPFPAEVRESIDVRFVPASAAAEAGEEAIDPSAEDPPDVYEGDTVDLGALVAEYLVLGLDPYPRKPGAVFAPGPDDTPETQPPSPFAVLGKLKDRR
jgi:uncharacterized metal-binding protein YceD (DUF177 family)